MAGTGPSSHGAHGQTDPQPFGSQRVNFLIAYALNRFNLFT